MCGIAGFTTPLGIPPEGQVARWSTRLRRMTASLRHRGPDALTGILLDGVALGHARLAIVDLSGGAQPMRDPATGLTLVYNGEVFNHVELREELSGYPFRTRSDTEVLLAAWLRWGPGCLERLNGQFAFALWDPRDRTLWLARDRVGILPLHHAVAPDGNLAFASEAKALVCGGFVDPVLDGRGLKQAIQLWSPVPPRTCVAGVSQLAPGTVARFREGRLEVRRWWDVQIEPDRSIEESAAVTRVGELLEDAVRLRLRADVPVGAYLSGGLDSATLCAVAQEKLGGTLRTYSIGFADPSFDESSFQREVAAALRTRHQAVVATGDLIGELLPTVVRHAEQVLIRSAPAPLLRLSQEVRADGGKVVLTGEGSDEIFLGYDLYREARVRAFWARQPGSTARPALLRRLYPYLPLGAQGAAVLQAIYGVGLHDPAAPAFSHLVRWTASGRVFRLFSPDFARAVADEDPVASAVGSMPEHVRGWPTLARAQWLEMQTLLAGNLLAAQGDRMLMGNSVEGRFPFLDHRLIEYAARLPVGMKLRGLAGKWVLRRYAVPRVPRSVVERPKFPYRAPAAARLVGPGSPQWARALLAPDAVVRTGVFDPDKVRRLIEKVVAARTPMSEVDAMSVTAVASAQLLGSVLAAGAPSREVEDSVRLEVA